MSGTSSTTARCTCSGGVDGAVVCCGRLVLPPGPLPTEVACGIVVEPAGRGRRRRPDGGRAGCPRSATGRCSSLSSPPSTSRRRGRGFTTGCGMMAPNVRALMRHLGVRARRPRRRSRLLGRAAGAGALRRAHAHGRRAWPRPAGSLQRRPDQALEDQAGVGAAEPERVRQRQARRRAGGATQRPRRSGSAGSRCAEDRRSAGRAHGAATTAPRSPRPPRSRRSCARSCPSPRVTGGVVPPNSAASAAASAASFNGVEVPWALTWATSAVASAGIGERQAACTAARPRRRGSARRGGGRRRWSP